MGGRSVNARLMRATIGRRMDKAKIGELTYGRKCDVEETRSHAPVLELRVLVAKGYMNGDDVLFRMYFVEPLSEPTYLVALKAALKDLSVPLFQQIQQEDIREANARMHLGESHRWGIGMPKGTVKLQNG